MATDWEVKPLGELVEDIIDRRGVTPLKLGSDFTSAGHRVISAKLIKNRQVDLAADEPRYIDEATFAKWMKTPLRRDDVVLTSEAPLGEPAYLANDEDWALGQRLFAIRTDKSQLHGRFLYYALQADPVRTELLSRATGTTVTGVRQSELRRVSVPHPPIDEQHRIAHILGTLDDKIELNRRMSETLEEMARALFKSWFVDFEPVRAKAEGRDPGLPNRLADLFPDRLVDSELGEIPEGWRTTTLADVIINLDRMRVPVSGAERESMRGQYPYHGASGVLDYVNGYLFDGVFVLVGEDGSVVTAEGMAVTQYVWGRVWVNNHAHVLTGAGHVSTEQLLLYFDFEPVAPYVTGAVQAKLSQGRMGSMPFVDAGKAVSGAFSELVDPWFRLRRHLADATRVLAATRDLLISQLFRALGAVPHPPQALER